MHIKISRNVQGRYNDYSTSKVTGNKRKLNGEKLDRNISYKLFL